jgi:Tfp pilus assembly protein PilW
MRRRASEGGFTLVELLASTTITLIVLAAATAAFQNALSLNEMAVQLADSSQNLRGGTNLLVRDLMLAGRLVPTGGISIPTGAGANRILRPSPPGNQYYFDNTTATTLPAVTTGAGLGPTVDGRSTDLVTIVTIDPVLDAFLGQPLAVKPNSDTTPNVPKMSVDGSSFNVATSTGWIAGDLTNNNRAPIMKGDLIMFTNPAGNTAIQSVTSTDPSNVYFASDADDLFNLNQRTAAGGSIRQILGATLTAQRVYMYTYYVDSTTTPGTPRLMRKVNQWAAQALAGVVEDLELSYDVVDGVHNPTNLKDLPYTSDGVTYSANQIRKASVRLGVRSEAMSTRTKDYTRSYTSTVVSLRNLAFVDRYR